MTTIKPDPRVPGLLVALLAVGCVVETNESNESNVELGASEQALSFATGEDASNNIGSGVVWPNGDVHICFTDDTFGRNASIVSVLQREWGADAKINFTYQTGNCSTVTGSHVNVVWEKRGKIGDISGNSPLGEQFGGTVILRFCDSSCNTASSSCDGSCASRPNDARLVEDATALHEFGHVLGFRHEHQRPDRPGLAYFQDPPGAYWCAAASPGEQTAHPVDNQVMVDDTPLTAFYDPFSVMNYCRDLDGDNSPDGYNTSLDIDQISDGDALGAEFVYGLRTGEPEIRFDGVRFWDTWLVHGYSKLRTVWTEAGIADGAFQLSRWKLDAGNYNRLVFTPTPTVTARTLLLGNEGLVNFNFRPPGDAPIRSTPAVELVNDDSAFAGIVNAIL